MESSGATEGQIDNPASQVASASVLFGPAEVVAKVADAAFGRPLVTNVLRAQLVEAMIALVLDPAWHWCGADYAPCDFERADGLRLEVKQSAARQSWSTDKPSKAIFDVAARTGRNEAQGWVEEYGRAAHLYVFAHHPTFDDSADHRDPAQWLFYVVPTTALPDVKQIALGTIKTMTDAVPISMLAETVAAVASTISNPRTA
ncbi:MAG: hypothetical protein DI623_06910 [Sphingomonas sanxanigenens]|uniref:Uncharacterized protein n=1 Tax=Sphingomonas sanxanigenens TaxID=397260 RepID=A0A2W5AB12_9SPHN|nr:MAG: hypothetical protein DI623_06910 [Sphingomonas sanxanigenens]